MMAKYMQKIMICNMYNMHIEVIYVAIVNNFKLYEEISVIDYDDIKISSMMKVPLATIKQPNYFLGRLATEQLLKILEYKSYC